MTRIENRKIKRKWNRILIYVLRLEQDLTLGMYWYIDGLSSKGISKLLSLDFPLLGEIPRFVCMFISDMTLDFPLLGFV